MSGFHHHAPGRPGVSEYGRYLDAHLPEHPSAVRAPFGKRGYSVGNAGLPDNYVPIASQRWPELPSTSGQDGNRGGSGAGGSGQDSRRNACLQFFLAHWKSLLQIITLLYVTAACSIFMFSGKHSAVALRHRENRAWVPGDKRSRILEGNLSADALQSSRAVRQPIEDPALSQKLPDDFDWRQYLRWNLDVRSAGIEDQAAAEQHYMQNGRAEQRLYAPANITLRYSACGGIFNQQYCHIAALLLAHMGGMAEVIWPPMQERASFAYRYNGDPSRNVQSWKYMDASSLWDIPAIQDALNRQFKLKVTPHAANCKVPNLLEPATAYQDCPLPRDYDLHVKYSKPIYIRHLEPLDLVHEVMMAVRDAYVVSRMTQPPKHILVDLPCTLFMLDFRKAPVVEELAFALKWAPSMLQLADKVLDGIRSSPSSTMFNGIHLRMEKDAMDWAVNSGGQDNYWAAYKSSMRKARFDIDAKPLYIASGLLRSDVTSREEIRRLSTEILEMKCASSVLHKEMFLREADLEGLLNEQSALIDFLVLRQAWSVVGIGMSTFSFYLQEERLMDGRDPRDMTLLMMPTIGTDELFFTSAVVAIKTRERLMAQNRLNEVCQRADLKPCFT